MKCLRRTYSAASRVRCVNIQNRIHLGVTNIHVLGFKFILRITTPRKSVIITSARKTVVSNSDNLVLAVYNAISNENFECPLTRHQLACLGLDITTEEKGNPTFTTHGTQAGQSHKILIPTDVVLALLSITSGLMTYL